MRIDAIKLSNFLSFGPDSPIVPLQNLNVMIGSNGSGKSNFVEVLEILKRTKYDLGRFLNSRGAFSDWKFRNAEESEFIQIDVFLCVKSIVQSPDRYVYSLYIHPIGGLAYFSESIDLLNSDGKNFTRIFGVDRDGEYVRVGDSLYRDQVDPDSAGKSIFQRYAGDKIRGDIFAISNFFESISIFDAWQTGRESSIRLPQRTDVPEAILLRDGSNLSMFLQQYKRDLKAKSNLVKKLSILKEDIRDFDVMVTGNLVQLFLHEGQDVVSAMRISDGTIRFIFLAAILCHPKPPHVVSLEEPELGLHPDIIPHVAEMLIEASARTQLIVTTHSEILIDALSAVPECVLVAERHPTGSVLRRLDKEKLAPMLEDRQLGQLWAAGELGGNRW